MSGYVQYAPAAIQAYGQYTQARSDASALNAQAHTTRDEALADEAATRRAGAQVLGRQAAAMAQAGGGMDEGVLKNSAVNAELDALNVRYAGFLRASGYAAQGAAAKQNAGLLAGATLLKGVSSTYTRGRQLKLSSEY